MRSLPTNKNIYEIIYRETLLIFAKKKKKNDILMTFLNVKTSLFRTQETFRQNKRKNALFPGQRTKKEKDSDCFFQRIFFFLFCFFVFKIETVLGTGAVTRFIRQLTFQYLNITERKFKTLSSVTCGLSSIKKYL